MHLGRFSKKNAAKRGADPQKSLRIHRRLVLMRACMRLRALRGWQTRREAGAQNFGPLLGEVAGLPNRGRGSFGNFPRGKERGCVLVPAVPAKFFIQK
jgi:hypothetical protein